MAEQHHAHVVAWQGEQLKVHSAEMLQLLYQILYEAGPAKALSVAHGNLAGALHFLDDFYGTAYVAETLNCFSQNLNALVEFTAALPESGVLQ